MEEQQEETVGGGDVIAITSYTDKLSKKIKTDLCESYHIN